MLIVLFVDSIWYEWDICWAGHRCASRSTTLNVFLYKFLSMLVYFPLSDDEPRWRSSYFCASLLGLLPHHQRVRFFRGLDVFVGSFYGLICHLLPTGILWIPSLLLSSLVVFSYSGFAKSSFLWLLHCSTVCVPFSTLFPFQWRGEWLDCTVFKRQKYKHSGNIRKYEVVTRSISCDAEM